MNTLEPTNDASGEPIGVFDVSETLALAAQQAFVAARRRRLRFLYDFSGEAFQVKGSAERVRTIAQHMFAWAIRSAKECVCFAADVSPPSGGDRCRLRLCATDADSDLPDVMALQPAEPWPGISTLTFAQTLCVVAGGSFVLARATASCAVVRAELTLDGGSPPQKATTPNAGGAIAWLVGDPPVMLEALARRLIRLGWQVRLFTRWQHALHVLSPVGAAGTPLLVLGAQPYGVEAQNISLLHAALPHDATVVWLVDAGARMKPLPRGNVSVYRMPIRQDVLLELTRSVNRAQDDRASSALTRAANPHDPRVRTRVVVIDEDSAHGTLTRDLLHRLGYEVVTATDGVDGLNKCLVHRPGALVMGQTPPEVDGLAITRKLRQWQRDGLIEPFPILAASSLDGARDTGAWRGIGMGGDLPDPLNGSASDA